MKKARIIDGVVDAISLESEGEGWVDCPDGVYAGHTFNGSTFSAPPPPAPPTAGELAAMLDAARDAIIARFDEPTSIDKVLFKISFLQENRIRALEGKQPITAQQFKDWVRTQID